MWAGLYLTPLLANEHSERSAHYGPSEVIHIENFDGGKYILCKYDRWFSCNTVNRRLLFFWGSESQPTVFENDKTQKIAYTWYMTNQEYKAFGIINDDNICKIVITLEDGSIFTQTDLYDNLFLFTWKSNGNSKSFHSISGYDIDNNVIFLQDF